jgi:hypothetical protein
MTNAIVNHFNKKVKFQLWKMDILFILKDNDPKTTKLLSFIKLDDALENFISRIL